MPSDFRFRLCGGGVFKKSTGGRGFRLHAEAVHAEAADRGGEAEYGVTFTAPARRPRERVYLYETNRGPVVRDIRPRAEGKARIFCAGTSANAPAFATLRDAPSALLRVRWEDVSRPRVKPRAHSTKQTITHANSLILRSLLISHVCEISTARQSREHPTLLAAS